MTKKSKIFMGIDIFSKLAYAEEFKETTKPQPAADYDAREKQSTGSTNKLPAEVEFRKISIEYIYNIVDNCIIMRFMYNNFTFIDLFAGIGGVRRSFESVGGNCVYTSEIDTSALKTYRANFSCDHKIDGLI